MSAILHTNISATNMHPLSGSDTVAGVATLVLFHIISQRTCYKKLVSEILDAFPDRPSTLASETLDSLPYLNATVDEGLRLSTPFAGWPRVVPKGGAILHGTFVPEATIVSVPTYSQAVSEENFWPDPKLFRPERWLPDGLGAKSRVQRTAVLAFSSGTISL